MVDSNFDTYKFAREFTDKIRENSKYSDIHNTNSYTIGYLESNLGTILMTLKHHHPDAFESALECMGESK